MIYPPNPYTFNPTLLKSLIQNTPAVIPESPDWLLNPKMNYAPYVPTKPSYFPSLNEQMRYELLAIPYRNSEPDVSWLLNPRMNFAPDVPTETPSSAASAKGIQKALSPANTTPLAKETQSPAIDTKKAKLDELQRWQLLSLFSQNMGYKPEEELPPPQVTSVGGQTVSFPQGDLMSLLSILGRSM